MVLQQPGTLSKAIEVKFKKQCAKNPGIVLCIWLDFTLVNLSQDRLESLLANVLISCFVVIFLLLKYTHCVRVEILHLWSMPLTKT